MNTIYSKLVLCGLVLNASWLSAGDIVAPDDAVSILNRVRHVYRSAPAYRAEGAITTHLIDPVKGKETSLISSFVMQLGRPRLYRITWSQQMEPLPPQRGAVWNAGEGPRLYLEGPRTCSTMESDRMALAAATGVSMGVAHFIPHLFFDLGSGTDPTARLSGLELETTQEVKGISCHVLRGTLSGAITYRLWVNQATFEILRIENAFGGGAEEKVPTMSAEEEEATLRSVGTEITEENRRRLRDAMTRARSALNQIRGKTVQGHFDIDMISVPEVATFDFPLPENVTVTEGPPGVAPPRPAAETDASPTPES